MKTKLVFSTETKDTEHWVDLPFIPRINEWINVRDVIETEEITEIKKAAVCWTGIRGLVQTVEYRRDDTGFYAEIYIWCED